MDSQVAVSILRRAIPRHRVCMPFTKGFAVDFEIVFCKSDPALYARETMRMIFLPPIRLQVLSFDTQIAFPTQRAVQFVVVAAAVGCVVEDVEFRRWEWCLACFAGEAFFVIASSQFSTGCFDGFSVDGLLAGCAIAFAWFAESCRCRCCS